MPPKKRTTGPGRRSKRLRTLPPADLQEAEPATLVHGNPPEAPPLQDTQMMQCNVQGLTSAIAAAVSKVVKEAMTSQQQSDHNSTANSQVDQIVDGATASITQGMPGPNLQISSVSGEERPQQIFTSIGINLGARVSAKLKAKIWAHEYVDFGALLTVAPPRERFALSMSSTVGNSGKPELTFEQCNSSKKVTNIQQWVTAFNIFASVYAERASGDVPKLLKYCEVVRDLSQKSADWLFYDEQFRYLRQSAPLSYPWDQIHWELWLRAMTNSRGRSQFSATTDRVNSRARFRPSSNNFPKGTCWAFHAGRQCKGCHYEHVCYKCQAQHPASQCKVSSTLQRSNKFGSSVATPGVGQPTSNARKGGSA